MNIHEFADLLCPIDPRPTLRDGSPAPTAKRLGEHEHVRRPLALVLVIDPPRLSRLHSPASLYEAFAPAEARRLAEKLEIHYTPKHGSWLNIAEIELKALTVQCMDRRIPTIEVLRREVSAWERERNRSGKDVDWQFTTRDARRANQAQAPLPADSSVTDH